MATTNLIIAESESSRFTAALLVPARETGPGMVLMSEVFGVTQAVMELASGYANQGYVVLVPDMFWRAGEKLTFGYDSRRDAGDAFLSAGGLVGHKSNFLAALGALRAVPGCNGGCAAIGFGIGGITAFAAAAENAVDAAVSFYPPILPLGDSEKLATPWQYHCGGADILVRDNLCKDVAARLGGRDGVDLRFYSGAAHGFAMPGAPGYDETAACAAIAASCEFLALSLGKG
jgi:carboxymethylenebutenolidase